MAPRFATAFVAWMCVLLIAAAALLRPGLVLCVSEHGHVAIEANCRSECRAECTIACEHETEHGFEAHGTNGGCRDLPVEFDLTSLQQRAAKATGAFMASDVPVAILEVPVALAGSYAPRSVPRELEPRPTIQLCALRVTIIQI